MADTPIEPRWYGMSVEEAAAQLQVDPRKGLSAAEVAQRKEKYGPNQLAGKKKEPGWRAFLRQYRDFMQILLVGAAVVNQVIVQELGTTLVLLGLTVFNAVLGMNQESKAEASLAALEKMLKSIARVRRDGQVIEIEAEELVPGDIVLMEAGNRVPADGRLLLAANVEIEEAALTGESVASSKDTDTISEAEVPLGDRHCMAFMNTSVTRGRAEMIVTATGHEDRDGSHRRSAQQDRGRQDPAAEATRPADHSHRRSGRHHVRHHDHPGSPAGPALRRHLPRRHSTGHLGHPDRHAGRRHHSLLDGHPGAGGFQRHRQAAALGGDSGVGVGHLLRQDRHARPSTR